MSAICQLVGGVRVKKRLQIPKKYKLFFPGMIVILGYIISPGYPKYYLGGRDCVWTLHAPVRQIIQVNLLDLNLQVGRSSVLLLQGALRLLYV